MAGKRSKLWLVVLIVAAVLLLGFLGLCCVTGWLGGNVREENAATISAARVACRAPMVFRLRPGGRSSWPEDWGCISAQALDAERLAVAAAGAAAAAAAAETEVAPGQTEENAAGDSEPDSTEEPSEVVEAPSSYWESLAWVGRRCPEELWSIVPNFVPANDEFARHDLEAQRASLREQVADTVYARTVRGRLGEYDFDRHRFPLEVDGMTACAPSIHIAFGRPSVEERSIPSRVGGAPLHHRRWQATAVEFFVPIDDEATARDLQRRTSGLLGRRIDVDLAFRVRRGRNDVRLGRGLLADRQDIGAGPLLTTEVVARRVRIGNELLFEDLPE